MALEKSLPTRFGVDASYWHIEATDMKWQSRFARIHTVGYADKVAADDSTTEPLERKVYVVRESDFTFDIDGNVLRQAYEYLKTQEPDFEGATDIFEENQTTEPA